MADRPGAGQRLLVAAPQDRVEPALPDTTVVDRAVLVANELVTNAVVHARTDLRLRLELRGDWLHIWRSVLAAPGCCERWPRTRALRGRGLWLVEQLARAWGINRHPDGGKVVWCTLKLYSP